MTLHTLDDAKLRWLDLRRDQPDLEATVAATLGLRPHDRHLSDLRNSEHPPFFDGTDQYDLLVVRALDARSRPEAPLTSTIALLILPDTVVSVRPPDDDTLDALAERFAAGVAVPHTAGELVHLMLNAVAERLLALRDPLAERLSRWQERLLDPRDPFDDWQVLMRTHSRMRLLGARMEMQREALDLWRNNTLLPLGPDLAIRFKDIDEHLGRVEHHVRVIQGDIDSLVQVHFAASSQKTNQVMQFLAVISAVFLPLNLIAGIFGMNFRDMPLLHLAYAGDITILAMVLLGALLLWWFWWRRWF